MKHLCYTFAILLLLSFNLENKCKNSAYLLEQSKKFHDPADQWKELSLNFHIQEPRIQNPSRYSILFLNNQTGAFELQRNRDNSISTHQIDVNGTSKVLLDGKEDFPIALAEKYRLSADRNKDYRRFYQLMYGLPMSLASDKLIHTKDATTTLFNQTEAYQIEIELAEAMISKHWRLYLSTDHYQLLGVDIFDPKDSSKGERILFDQLFEYKGLQLPRMRHWHALYTEEYIGSDLIIKTLD